MKRSGHRLLNLAPPWRVWACGAVLLIAATVVSGCKIMTIEEDRQARARQSDQFEAGQYVAGLWGAKALPYLKLSARPLAEVLTASGEAKSAGGRQAGEGSPWTFVVQGEGTVRSVDRSSRIGVVTMDVQTPAGPRSVSLRAGPVVPGTTIRDALPFISFNDFANQIAFAEVGNALTAQAGRATLPVLDTLKAGDTVKVLGVFSRASSEDPVVLTAVEVAR